MHLLSTPRSRFCVIRMYTLHKWSSDQVEISIARFQKIVETYFSNVHNIGKQSVISPNLHNAVYIPQLRPAFRLYLFTLTDHIKEHILPIILRTIHFHTIPG